MKEAILNKIFEIEKELANYTATGISLYSGSMGIALFYSQLFKMTSEEKYAQKAVDLVDQIISQLSEMQMTHTLADGFTGVAWGINYLAKKGFVEENPDELFQELDPYIQDAGLRDLSAGRYDFLHGGMGPIIFSLNRLPDKNARSFLEQALKELDQTKIEDEYGFKWMDKFNKQYAPAILYNFGLAHGIPGIVLVLLKMYLMDVFPGRASELIHGTLAYISGHKNVSSEFISLYPSMVSDEENSHANLGSRLAWCYGDLSIGLMYWNAGEVLGEAAWKEEGLRIMKHSLNRGEVLTHSNLDAGFCHGTAGIAYMFRKFYRATGNPEFLDRASFWINETLSQAKFEKGLAGYKVYNSQFKEVWINNHGLLEGITGIGLVLIDFLGEVDSDWDECLLLS